MSVSMIAKHRVEDFDRWKKAYDEEGVDLREQGGVVEAHVHVDLDDPQMVTVYHQFPDERTARDFAGMLDSDDFRGLADKTGIDLNSLEVSLLADVE